MKKSELLRVLQQEILRHDFGYFVDQPPSIAQGGKGFIVPGCPARMKRINTVNQFRAIGIMDLQLGLVETYHHFTIHYRNWRCHVAEFFKVSQRGFIGCDVAVGKFDFVL